MFAEVDFATFESSIFCHGYIFTHNKLWSQQSQTLKTQAMQTYNICIRAKGVLMYFLGKGSCEPAINIRYHQIS